MEFRSSSGDQFYFGGVKFHNYSLEQARELMLINLKSTSYLPLSIRFVNAYSISIAYKSHAYIELLNNNGINLVDSRTISILARFCILKNIHQVRGIDFFRNIINHSKNDLKHFFLGGTNEQLIKLVQSIKLHNSEIQIVGTYAPEFKTSFTSRDIIEISRIVVKSNADLIWISLGTPKQDLVAFELAEKSRITSIAVGAAFGFYSGEYREAPRIISYLNLEWLFRLCQEPKRLWKRYLIGNLIFLKALVSSIFSKKVL